MIRPTAMEPLGKKLQQARLAKNISLDEASRVTKIRPARIAEIEAEDFSSFPSLAYAKGFLLIYGKFLDVDVSPYLEAFETSDRVTVDGYSYLQDNVQTAPAPIVRRAPRKRPALLPFFISIAVLVFGLYFVKLLLDIQRIAPPHAQAPTPSITPSATASYVVAPRALPVEGTPPNDATATPVPTAAPSAAVAAESPPPSATEPEVRRAEPVHAQDGPATAKAATNLPNRVQITPIRKTFVRVTLDDQPDPIFAGWLSPSDAPLTYVARHVTVKVLEPGTVDVMKNGIPLAADDRDVTVR